MSQDSIRHNPAEYLSGTLPVLYITTEDEQPVQSKDEYLNATYYLDAENFGQYQSIGSEDSQLGMKIKGRGNATWRNPKKPYRIKLDKKASLLGLNKSKHFCLMAAYADWRGKGRDYMAFEISRRMGMPWTPGDVPCELVLNGDYMGLYFIVEKIRIASDRVNIVDQEEEGADPDDVTGGWLLEIDNYTEDNQVRINDIDGSLLKFTYHSPEEPNESQLSYIKDLLTRTHQAVVCQNKSSREWESLIDIDACVRFYVIQEAVDNQEAYSGSCWFYKDQGDSSKFIFGPVWDFGSSMGSRNYPIASNFMYENTVSYVNNHWIKELVKFPRFQIAVRKYWKKYRDEVLPQMEQVAMDLASAIEVAGDADYKRWNDGSSLYLRMSLQTYVSVLKSKAQFLADKWNQDYSYPLGDVNFDGVVDVSDINMTVSVIIGSGYDSDACDVNDDGVVDVKDVNLIISQILYP